VTGAIAIFSNFLRDVVVTHFPNSSGLQLDRDTDAAQVVDHEIIVVPPRRAEARPVVSVRGEALLAWVMTAPTRGVTWMQRDPTAISLVAMAIPNIPVRSQRPMREKVVNSIPINAVSSFIGQRRDASRMRYDSAGTPSSPWEMTSASPYPVPTA